jgi:hypothetical protein
MIENYLSGYSVIPLPPNLPHLFQEIAMADLLRDTQFGLVTLLETSLLAVVETEYTIYVSLPSALVSNPLTRVAVRRGCPTGWVHMYGSDSIYFKKAYKFISSDLRLKKSLFPFTPQ